MLLCCSLTISYMYVICSDYAHSVLSYFPPPHISLPLLLTTRFPHSCLFCGPQSCVTMGLEESADAWRAYQCVHNWQGVPLPTVCLYPIGQQAGAGPWVPSISDCTVCKPSADKHSCSEFKTAGLSGPEDGISAFFLTSLTFFLLPSSMVFKGV